MPLCASKQQSALESGSYSVETRTLMIAEVTFALCFGSFGWFKIIKAHE